MCGANGVGDHYEVETHGAVQTTLQYYTAAGQRIAVRTNGTLTYLLADHLGSTSLAVTATGALSSEQRYTAFGQTRYAMGDLPTTYEYTGQRNEELIGLYFYRARWYDPGLGRFVQADSVLPSPGNPLAWDRYAYGLDNPVKHTDPTGRSVRIPPLCPTGCPILDMSSWATPVRVFVQVALALTVDNVTSGRTGVYGNGTWGVIPDAEYVNSGAWMAPPAFGVVGGTDDLIRAGTKLAREGAEEVVESADGLPRLLRRAADIQVDPRPPRALDPDGRVVGRSPAQNAQLQRDLELMHSQGARDVRVDQQQVNALGQRMGLNRPDLQGTIPDVGRVYIEYDRRLRSSRLHSQRILANDPLGRFIGRIIE